MVLTPEELALFDHGLSLEENPRSACVAAMKFIQDRRGWVNDEAMEWLSVKLDMPRADLESVATFYSLIFRKPVGRHVILMCDSVSCWIMGCETVADHLRRRLGIDLGQTTPDGLFTWLTIPCLGACDMAPAMMVDEVLCGPLTPELIDKVLDACVAADSL
ncbi:MAG: NADH-quinone oxidoreductase subunit NuoE [Thermoanaerobaculales bacterium]|nr:NADH-quinone oxidoreductase subunit NuoE [Thermoanaerobaculales bacterium]